MLKRVFIALLTLQLFGCAASMRPLDKPANTDSAGRESEFPDLDERLIVSSADLEIKTSDSDSLHNKVMDIATKYDGYVLSSSNDITTIRLPAVSFEKALDDIEILGEVIKKNVEGNDVTEQYRDLEIRLENLIKTRERYLALLERANNIDEILRLEKELERFNGRIESLKGSLQRLTHLVQFTSITVKTFETVKPGPISYAFYQLYSGVKWLFVRN